MEHRLLSIVDIRTFADHEIISASEAVLADVAELCTATTETDVRGPLERLVPSPSMVALRIWRAVLLDQLLQTPRKSPIDTLVDLTSFWASFGHPPDSPHVVQGRGNSLSPEEYYTDAMADRALEQHRYWLGQELAWLRETAPAGQQR